jgi:hypothetical protein
MGLSRSADRIKLPSSATTYRARNLHLVPPPPPHGECNSLVPFGPAETGRGPLKTAFSFSKPSSGLPETGRSLSKTGSGPGSSSIPLYPPSVFCLSSGRGDFLFFIAFQAPVLSLVSLLYPLPFSSSSGRGFLFFVPSFGLLVYLLLVSLYSPSRFCFFPGGAFSTASCGPRFPFVSPLFPLLFSFFFREGEFYFFHRPRGSAGPRRGGSYNRLLITRETA